MLEEKNADQAFRILFLIGAAIMRLLLDAFLKPRSVFDMFDTNMR